VVVVVSAVSMCNQNVSVAWVAAGEMLTCCQRVSVCAAPYPSSQAFHVPECAGSEVELLSMTPDVTVHGTGFEAPFSNPALPSIACVVPPPPLVATVSATVVECVLPPPVPVTEKLYVPVATAAPTEILIVEEPAPGAPIDVGLKVAVAPVGNPVAE